MAGEQGGGPSGSSGGIERQSGLPNSRQKTLMEPSNSADTHAEGGSSINNITVNLGGTTVILIAVMLVVIFACGVMLGIDAFERTEYRDKMSDLKTDYREKMADLQRQYRMTELKLDDWTVVAHRSGLVLPGDYTRGPQGNPDLESFKKGK